MMKSCGPPKRKKTNLDHALMPNQKLNLNRKRRYRLVLLPQWLHWQKQSKSPLNHVARLGAIADGKIEGAIKTETGWKIPIPSLVSSGAWDGISAPDENTKVEETTRVSELEAELLRARLELNSEKKLREAAERNADDLRFAMRMLTAGTSTSTAPQPTASTEKRSVQYQRPQSDRWEFTPAAIIDAANKFRRKLLG